MTAINKGNRVWIIRDDHVVRGVVTSSYGDSCGIMYRVRWGERDAAWSGIATVSHRDVFRLNEEATACGVLADRLTATATALRARACKALGVSESCPDQHLCRHGIND